MGANRMKDIAFATTIAAAGAAAIAAPVAATAENTAGIVRALQTGTTPKAQEYQVYERNERDAKVQFVNNRCGTTKAVQPNCSKIEQNIQRNQQGKARVVKQAMIKEYSSETDRYGNISFNGRNVNTATGRGTFTSGVGRGPNGSSSVTVGRSSQPTADSISTRRASISIDNKSGATGVSVNMEKKTTPSQSTTKSHGAEVSTNSDGRHGIDIYTTIERAGPKARPRDPLILKAPTK